MWLCEQCVIKFQVLIDLLPLWYCYYFNAPVERQPLRISSHVQQTQHMRRFYPTLHITWVSNPQFVRVYNAARGHIYKLRIYYKNYTIISAFRYATYSYFPTCVPRTSPQQQLWPFATNSPDAHDISESALWLTYSHCTDSSVVYTLNTNDTKMSSWTQMKISAFTRYRQVNNVKLRKSFMQHVPSFIVRDHREDTCYTRKNWTKFILG